MSMATYSRNEGKCKERPAATRQALHALLAAIGAMLVIAGCTAEAAQPEPDLIATLPTDWVVVNTQTPWIPVNIDYDQEVEFLLLYTYNNQVTDGEVSATGPTGASIFDLQNNSELVPQARVVSMPYQPSASYTPYRILPNYWKGSDTGFIAAAGRQSDVTSVEINRAQEREVIVVTPSTPEEGSATDVEITMEPIKELYIQDGGQAITIVWWRSLLEGYGTANIHAAAGFRDPQYEAEGEPTTPLTAITGLHPFHDRSELCNVTRYTREYLDQKESVGSEELENDLAVDIRFVEEPLGIQFCKEPPTTPFYPEAVVLKYLFNEKSEDELLALDDVNMKEVADPLTTAFRAEDSPLRIISLYGPELIPFDNVDGSPATVCASFLDTSTDTLTAYRFRLLHVMADVDEGTTDQFKITNIKPIPAPPNGPEVECNKIVKDGTPGRVPPP